MKTFVPKKPDMQQQKWYIIDAENQTLGKLSTKIANILRGKDKAIFTPHMDCGDMVVVINAEKVAVTGNKEEQKMYYRHSGYPGGLKQRSLGEQREKNPTKILEVAVKGMLPKNRLNKDFMRKLKIYPGSEHPHTAQQPETVTL